MKKLYLITNEIYVGGNRELYRRVNNLFQRNGKIYVEYNNCGYTEKSGWYDFGEYKQCLEDTFVRWAKYQVLTCAYCEKILSYENDYHIQWGTCDATCYENNVM